nr:hypothetical protein CFP56_58726 [Quercus suber]
MRDVSVVVCLLWCHSSVWRPRRILLQSKGSKDGFVSATDTYVESCLFDQRYRCNDIVRRCRKSTAPLLRISVTLSRTSSEIRIPCLLRTRHMRFRSRPNTTFHMTTDPPSSSKLSSSELKKPSVALHVLSTLRL